MWIQPRPLGSLRGVRVLNTNYLSRIDMTGDAVGISVMGSMAQVRITKNEFSRVERLFQIQKSKDLPAPVRHKD